MKTFFTSDTHFGGERTRKLSHRPFKNTKQMDKALIKNWNKLVKKDDVVYHLGDFGNYEVVKKLNGKIIFLFGNYERYSLKNNFDSDLEKFTNHLLGLGFHKVHAKPFYISEELFGRKVKLCHEPTCASKRSLNFFGHVHRLNFIKDFGINVGTDNFHFYPAKVEELKFYINAIDNHYDKEVYLMKNDLEDELEKLDN